MASWLASGVAAAEVCDAARWPAGDRPPMTVSRGIRCATRRAVRANLRGLPKDSTYRTAIWVTSSCAHQVSRSVGDTSYVAGDAKEDTPIPSRDICSSSAIPTPPDCTTRAGHAADRVAGGESGVQADPRHDHAETARPEQPHAIPTADGQQLRARGAPALTDDDEGPDPVAAALLRHPGHRRRRHRDHRQVYPLGQVLDRRHAGHSLHLHGLSALIDRVDRTGEAARHDVVQDGASHSGATAARARHGDRW